VIAATSDLRGHPADRRVVAALAVAVAVMATGCLATKSQSSGLSRPSARGLGSRSPSPGRSARPVRSS